MYVMTIDSMKGEELRLIVVLMVPVMPLKLTPVRDKTNNDAPTLTPES